MLGRFLHTSPFLALSFVCGGGGGEVFPKGFPDPRYKEKSNLVVLVQTPSFYIFSFFVFGVLYYGHFSAWLEWVEFFYCLGGVVGLFFLVSKLFSFFSFFYTTTFQDINMIRTQTPTSVLTR